MRSLFQKQEIQEQIKSIFERSGYTYVPNLYWDEFVDFLIDENHSFSDILPLLNEDYHVTEEDALQLSDELFTLLYPYRKELKNFFGTGSVGSNVPSRNDPRSRIESDSLGGRQVSADVKIFADGQGDMVRQAQSDKKNKASFYFSPEDEEEIRKASMGYTVSPTLRRSGQAAKEAMDKVYDRVAEEVMKKAKME